MLNNLKNMLNYVRVMYNKSINSIITNPKYYAAASVFEILIAILLVFWINPYNVKEKYPILSVVFILILSLIQVLTYLFVNNKRILERSGAIINPTISDVILKIIITLVFIAILVASVYYIIKFITFYKHSGTILQWVINISFIITSISLVILLIRNLSSSKDKFTHENIYQNSTIFGLIKNLILFIPCKLIDVVEWFKYQSKITTPTMWLVLLLQFFIITLNFLIPYIFSKIINSDGVHILKSPIYIDNETEINTYKKIHEKYSKKYKYEYSLSSWFWINPQPPNTKKAYTKFTNILDYGGMPTIQINSKKNKLRVKIKNNVVFETSTILYQRWNNLTVNYDKGTMDIFINGELVSSTPSISPYLTMENIKVGEHHGIEGAMTNIVYYNRILSSVEISYIYKGMRLMDIPKL